MTQKLSDKSFIYPDWHVPNYIKSFQTTRNGGFSKKEDYRSLNLSKNVGDDRNCVDLNLGQIEKKIKNSLFFLSQNHGNEIIQLPQAQLNLNADAAYTKVNIQVCSVLTADCLPILLTDTKGSFVAAIHAGWRGLGNGIIENTVHTIRSPNDLIVWFGPCISQEMLEVGPEVYSFFMQRDENIKKAFIPKKNNKFLLSLTTAAQIKFINLDVKLLYGNGITQKYCTFAQQDQFYSFRRNQKTGRMATMVWIDKN